MAVMTPTMLMVLMLLPDVRLGLMVTATKVHHRCMQDVNALMPHISTLIRENNKNGH